MNERDFAELAAGSALHALSPADAEAFEAARMQHPEWEHHVMTAVATAALLADGVADAAPPPALRDALLAQIDEAPRVAPAPPVQVDDVPSDAGPQEPAPPRRRPRRVWFVLAASIALLVGVGWGAVFVSEQLTTPASVVALDQIESAPDAQSATATLSDGGEVTVHWSETVGKVVLVSGGLPEIADDESYELWFVRDGSPIPAGVFSAEDGSATALLEGDMEVGDVVAITVEAAGGSPSGLPTSEPIVAIVLA